jgi:hypothetical protein
MRTSSLPSFLWTLVAGMSLVAGCSAQESSPAKTNTRSSESNRLIRVREPAVAGLFYPKEADALSAVIDRLLKAAPAPASGTLKALVCPHAGYPYSGPTAASAYRLLISRPFKTVVLLAPSHYASFQGASVCSAEVFKTPLGTVPISDRAKDLAKTPPFVLEPKCRVQRPGWAVQASRTPPAPGEDTPHTWEHSEEVQVPFLQATLKNFKLLPIVLGEVDPEQVARGLAPLLDHETLLIASSDLSHYHPYDVARRLDARCVNAITNLNLDDMRGQEACGKVPILAVLHLAKSTGWQARLLDYRNSGDTAGDKSGVVGYAAIAFFEPDLAAPKSAPAPDACSTEEKRFLLTLARKTIQEAVATGRLATVDEATVPRRLTEKRGCFVTLTKKGQLRGCIGHIVPQEPLYLAVMQNAVHASLRDPRFPPVTAGELNELDLEISILTEPQPLVFSSPEDLLQKLRPRQDGVVLNVNGRTSTFLPQVWEQLPDKLEFLDHLAMKAGGIPADWRKPGANVSVYQVVAFKESDR